MASRIDGLPHTWHSVGHAHNLVQPSFLFLLIGLSGTDSRPAIRSLRPSRALRRASHEVAHPELPRNCRSLLDAERVISTEKQRCNALSTSRTFNCRRVLSSARKRGRVDGESAVLRHLSAPAATGGRCQRGIRDLFGAALDKVLQKPCPRRCTRRPVKAHARRFLGPTLWRIDRVSQTCHGLSFRCYA